jgi:Bacteriocin-protection, YdeI or OmpD-Associated
MSLVAKKLQIKPGKSWLFYHAPQNYLSILEPLPDGVTVKFDAEGKFDGIQLFVINSADLATHLKAVAPFLKADTVFWISYPKKSSAIKSDLEMMNSWDDLKQYGLRTVASAAIDDTWTALRFKPEGQSKLSDFRVEAIKKNEYAAFIDPENRTITLPVEMQQVLAGSTTAITFYESLSFSNKKEYVVWILSAKQEKTKTERLERLLEKLLAGKKNPSEK